MKKIAIIIFILFSTTASASEWKFLPTYDLYQLLYSDLAKITNTSRKAQIVGTSGLSWPDGKQAIVTFVNVTQKDETWVYRCTQYFSPDMQQTGEACYELRK